MPTLQSHTYRIRTMPPADQKCGKRVPVPTQKEFQGTSKNLSDEAFRFFNDEFTDCK
jgi:hypothetical protein